MAYACCDHRCLLPPIFDGRRRRRATRGSSCPPSITLEYRRLLGSERSIGAFEILGLHANGLRLSLRLDALIKALAPLLVQPIRFFFKPLIRVNRLKRARRA